MSVLTETKLNTFLSKLNLDINTNAQKEALQALENLDFPTTRDEYYKYTRLNKIANADLTVGHETHHYPAIKDVLVSKQFVVIENGVFRADVSSFALSEVAVNIETISEFSETTAKKDDLFQLLNIAGNHQTVFITIPEDTQWDEKVQVIFINTEKDIITNTHLVIETGKGAEGHVITNFISTADGPSFSNHFTEVQVAENAHIKLDKIQTGDGWYVATENVQQAANSSFKINTITLKGDIVRNNLNIEVGGENCETFLNGAVLTKNNQLVDNHTFVNHLVSNCMSDENYKYVLDGKSTGVFNGRVIVQQDAQKINAYQQNGNVLLSDFAKINSKPELEIYADDVKCSHGSTTGQLDDDALFYLQTRGISKQKARNILVSAFAGEVFDAIEDQKLADYVNGVLHKEFGWTN
ncbi:MAG: Fe-S cluster assembly protein SufD [Putridiphycobacter sp.]|nr:Fe-S cluster assembly protein SufD [Putridiphycobacter sp.]